ncbi:MAG: cytidine deaminase [Micrococcales bacterium 73-15]|uniref:cytidine deaminase n=1 Tax=Salana multivorans TaxID=120377 RepID=UPI00095C5CEB|nr:cytidine deaminase [Salana multivorans]OJX97873.1 MAG: cytidine deaminase [Micrococcales bacterium 73-15]
MSSNPSREVDWDALRAEATAAMRRAYAPYSGFPVGAAALTTDGRLISGCNIENAAYGVTLCAECSLVSALVMGGGGRLAAFTCVNADGEVIAPCGRCRQLLWEHGGPDLLVETAWAGVVPMTQVLPGGFGPDDLVAVETSRKKLEQP